MTDLPTAADIARRVADVLERRGLPYAIGGAIALGFYAAPRATIDVDVNIFVPPAERLHEILAALAEVGFSPHDDPAVLERNAISEGQFRGTVEGLRLDVFVPAIPYYAELMNRRREASLLGRPIWILDAADLVVLKMMFFRRKDLADVESILRNLGPDLDRRFVHGKLTDLVGSEDERIEALASIERDVDSESG
jgi:hypothetical protein